MFYSTFSPLFYQAGFVPCDERYFLPERVAVHEVKSKLDSKHNIKQLLPRQPLTVPSAVKVVCLHHFNNCFTLIKVRK
jgi:hypothetical protein